MLRIKKAQQGGPPEYALTPKFASKTLWLAIALSAVAHLTAVGLFRIRLFTPSEEPSTYKATAVAIDQNRYGIEGVDVSSLEASPPLTAALLHHTYLPQYLPPLSSLTNPFIASHEESFIPRLELLQREETPSPIVVPTEPSRCFPVRITLLGPIASRTLLCDGSQLFRLRLPEDHPILLFKPRCAIEYSVVIDGGDTHISSWKRCGNLKDSIAQKCADEIITALRFAPSTSGNGTIRIEFSTTGKKLKLLREKP